jgi:hypothetical protein
VVMKEFLFIVCDKIYIFFVTCLFVSRSCEACMSGCGLDFCPVFGFRLILGTRFNACSFF